LQKSLRLYSADSLTRRTEGRDIVASTLAHANVWMHVRGELIRDEAGEPSILVRIFRTSAGAAWRRRAWERRLGTNRGGGFTWPT
jgi:hypothetical protein